jgi:uncharacterized surface protein with fasciclin (FAS1) repeats
LALLAAGCSGDGNDPAPAAGRNFGPACSAAPASGAGSFMGMAQDPVATAASNNPVLSSLVGAVKEAALVDTLNSAEQITVFAPTDDAFSALPKATLDTAMADPKGLLTTVLTYHVVVGKLSPSAASRPPTPPSTSSTTGSCPGADSGSRMLSDQRAPSEGRAWH